MKNKIIEELIKELKSLSSEKPQDFYYVINGYVDDYDESSMGSLIREWNKEGYEIFDRALPITAKLYLKLKNADDGIEKSQDFYNSLIALSKEALAEVEEFASSELGCSI